jgi:hypothetical protein
MFENLRDPCVIPAEAGIQCFMKSSWIPVFTGMTKCEKKILRVIFVRA